MNLQPALGCLFLACLTSASSALASPYDESGTLVGRVLNEKGLGLQWASVTVLNASRGAQTDQTGTFKVTFIPKGKHTVRASMVGYARSEITNVQIDAGDTTSVVFMLKEKEIKIIACPIIPPDHPRSTARPPGSLTVRRGILYLGGNRFQAPLTLRCRGAQVVVDRWKLPPFAGSPRSVRVPTRDDTLAFRLDSTPTALARYGLSVGLARSQILEQMRGHYPSSLIVAEARLDSGAIGMSYRDRPAALQIVGIPDAIPMREDTRRSDDFQALAALREAKADLESGAVVVISRKGWATLPARYAKEADDALQAMQRGTNLTDAQRELLASMLPRDLLEELKAPLQLVELTK